MLQQSRFVFDNWLKEYYLPYFVVLQYSIAVAAHIQNVIQK